MAKPLTEDQQKKRAQYAKTYYKKHRKRIVEHQRKLRSKGAKPGKPIKHRAPKRTGLNRYWDEPTVCAAIIRYNQSEDQEERNKIFVETLEKPFAKLVENVFNTFHFSYCESGPIEAQKECIGHLVANSGKFESDKGKAFSYFSIVAKNYLIALNNTTYKRFNTNTSIHELADQFNDDSRLPSELTGEDEERKDFQHREFFQKMISWWDENIERMFPKRKDLIIAQSVIELFRHSDRLENINKKALYLMIREIAGCNKTSYITRIVNKMIRHYQNIRREYVQTGDIQVGNASFAPKVIVREEEESAFSA